MTVAKGKGDVYTLPRFFGDLSTSGSFPGTFSVSLPCQSVSLRCELPLSCDLAPMSRPLRVAAAQVGRVDRGSPRPAVLARLVSLVESASARGVQLVVFPETTFTTFFPRYLIRDPDELASYFERETSESGIVDSPNVKPLFDRARELRVDIVVGYAELTPDGTPYNTCAYVSAATGAVAKYRKVHLPGTVEPFSEDPDKTNQLEKRYFKPGNLGFKAFSAPSLDASDDLTTSKAGPSPIVGMLICNDRRWAEAWRVYGLQGTEIMCCGYNTTAFAPELWGSDLNITREQGRADAMVCYNLTAQVLISCVSQLTV
jgi:predicted amidohydrolase